MVVVVAVQRVATGAVAGHYRLPIATAGIAAIFCDAVARPSHPWLRGEAMAHRY